MADVRGVHAGCGRVAGTSQAHRRRLKQGHPRESRSREMEWPAFVQCNRELDTIGERYGVSFW